MTLYKPGDPAPDSYLGWHEWAEVQIAAGIEQTRCASCGLWVFEQEHLRHTLEMGCKGPSTEDTTTPTPTPTPPTKGREAREVEGTHQP